MANKTTSTQDRIKKAEDAAAAAAVRAQKLRQEVAQQKKKEDTRRTIVVGGAALALMREDAGLRARIRAALDKHFAKSPETAELFDKVNFWENLAPHAGDEDEVGLDSFFEGKTTAPTSAPSKSATAPAPVSAKAEPKNETKPAPTAARTNGANGAHNGTEYNGAATMGGVVS